MSWDGENEDLNRATMSRSPTSTTTMTKYFLLISNNQQTNLFLQVVDAEATSPAMDATCETCSGAKTSLERLEALGHELDDLKKALNAATGQAGNVFDVVFAPPPPTPPAPVVAPQNVN